MSRLTKYGDKKLSLYKYGTYGVGSFGINFVWAMINLFFTTYITDCVFPNNPKAVFIVGIIILLSMIFDGITDVFMGIIIDRTKSRFGKARPWLIRAAIPLAISYVLLFTVPGNIGDIYKLVYIFLLYNITGAIFYTAISIPFTTIAIMMTRDQMEIGFLSMVREVFAGFVSIAAPFLAPIILNANGGYTSPYAWTLLITICSGILFACVILTFFTCPEKYYNLEEQKNKEKIKLKENFKLLLANKYWIIITLYAVVHFVKAGFDASTLYYVRYILLDIDNAKNYYGLLTTAGAACTGAGFIFIPILMKKKGKQFTCLIGLIVNTIGNLILIINPFSFTLAIISSGLKMLGHAPSAILIFALITDTIEYGEWKTGKRTEGLVNSAASFGMKLGAGIGSALILCTLALTRYDQSLAINQPDTAISGIKLLYIYFPLILNFIGFYLMMKFDLDKHYDNIVKELRERKAKEA